MRLVRLLPHRLRALAPEALRFGAVGLANTVLYFVIFNLAMGIGVVKAAVIATVVTTTLSYLANRHWTYRHRPKSALRREYTLFFAFNLAGMVIQAGVVGIGKYGLGLSEETDRIAFNVATCIGIGLATLFRFWSYRTMVFRPATTTADPVAAIADPAATTAEPAAEPAVTLRAPQPRAGDAADLAGIEDVLDVELRAELAAAELTAADRKAAGAS
jgi:putative flippase GtrA